MRRVLKNRKVMNVVSVAIAAMIAATSFPSTVLAVDDAMGTEIVEKAGEALEEETQDTAEEGGSAENGGDTAPEGDAAGEDVTSIDEAVEIYIELIPEAVQEESSLPESSETSQEPAAEEAGNQGEPAADGAEAQEKPAADGSGTQVEPAADGSGTQVEPAAENGEAPEAAGTGLVEDTGNAIDNAAKAAEELEETLQKGTANDDLTAAEDEKTLSEIIKEAGDNIDSVNNDLTQKSAGGDSQEEAADKTAGDYLKAAQEAQKAAEEVLNDESLKEKGISLTDLNKLTEKLEGFKDETVDASESDARNAITEADKANKAADEDEFNEAKSNAEASLDKAQKGLETATQAYDKASEYIGKVESELNAAEEKYEEARKELDRAKEKLSKAGEDAKKAEENLAAAQEKLVALGEDVRKYSDSKEALEGIKDQYYALMINYYRTILGNDVVYDGTTLDVDACAAKLSQKQINNKAASSGSDFYKLAGYLTKLLVENIINNYEDVDPATANIRFGETGTNNNEEIRKGVVYTGKDKNEARDMVVVSGDATDYEGNKVKPAPETDTNAENKIKWNKFSGNGGRENFVNVVYTDKNGEDHTLKYNYVLKSSDYEEGSVNKAKNGNNEKTDIQNGMFYLAEIDGKNLNRVTDANNFDDYSKLVKVLAGIDAYDKAQGELKAARDKVGMLQNELNRLQGTSIDDSAKNALKAALKDAQDELKKAKEIKDGLQAEVDKAKEAVESIIKPSFTKIEEELPGDKKDDETVEDKKDDETVEDKKDETPVDDKTDETPEQPANGEEEDQPATHATPVVDNGDEEEPVGPAAPPVDPYAPGRKRRPVNPAAPAAVVTNDDAGDVTPDENTVVPAAGEVIPAQGQTPAADETPAGDNGEAVAPADGQDGAVLGVIRRPENNGGETVDAVESEGEGEVEAEPESRDTVVVPPTKTEQTTIKTIEDEDVALAAGPVEANAHFNWWWLLLLLVIALTAKYIHDERMKRAAAANNSEEE